MNEEVKILTLNLDGKKGVNILKSRYDMMKISIINALKVHKELTLSELNSIVEEDLKEKFDGKIGWYLMAIKLDLEVREIIARVPNKSPQTLGLIR